MNRAPRPGRRRRCAAAAIAGPLAVAMSVLAAAPASAAPKPADTVLLKATVLTFDAKNRTANAVAIRRGKIVYVGSEAGAREYVGRRTKVRDLRGRVVMPGLHDAHAHVMSGGSALMRCDLAYEGLTVQEFQARIQACLDEDTGAGDDRFLVVVNWYRQAMKPAGTDANKATLDALGTRRPIVVRSSDGHSTLANSRALQIGGVTAATPDPPSGHIVKGPDGEPTGILEDAAGGLVEQHIPAPTPADDRRAFAAAMEALAAQGVTSVADQITTEGDFKAYKAAFDDGDLTLRMHTAPDISVEDATASPRDAVRKLLTLRRRYETRLGTVAPGISVRNSGELFQDGVLQAPAHTASLLEPYFDAQGNPTTNRGPDPYWQESVLRDTVLELARNDFAPQVHAIGDRAVRHTLDVFAEVRGQRVGRDVRLSMAHAEIVDRADFRRFKQLDVAPVMSFQWAKPAPDSIEAAQVFMGPLRFAHIEPEGSLQKAGAPIAYGSDWPVDRLDEWFALEVGVTRTNDPESGYTGDLNDEDGLTPAQSLRAITQGSANAMGTGDRTGSVERGKLADIIVIDQNPLRVPHTRISETKVLETIVGGKTVFKAGR